MSSLDDHFAELRSRLQYTDRLSSMGGDPIFYLVFPPAEMLEVKRRLKFLKLQLEHDGWTVTQLSCAAMIGSAFQSYPLRNVLLRSEQDDPLDFLRINESLRDILGNGSVIEDEIRKTIRAVRAQSRPLMLLTDLEALHPFVRIGAIEQSLQGSCDVPLVILYPGVRAGKNTLSFLGLYPDDGNYRSVHIG